MILVIGGCFQGKKAFAEEMMQIEKWEDGMTCEFDVISNCQGMVHFHEYIKRYLQEGKDASVLAERIIKDNPDIVLVSNELGYGVVPIDAFDRQYRETVGRVMTKLAKEAINVYRVTCGVGVKIK